MKSFFAFAISFLVLAVTANGALPVHEPFTAKFKKHHLSATKHDRGLTSMPGHQKNFTWDDINNEWIHDDDDTFTYNANGRLTLDRQTDTMGNDLNRAIYTLNGQGFVTLKLGQFWNGSGWDNSYQVIKSFDAMGHQTSNLNQLWNGSAWDNDSKDSSSFDQNGNQTAVFYFSWGGTWDIDFAHRDIYTYDSHKNILSDIAQEYNAGNWDNLYEYDYAYNANDVMTLETDLNYVGGQWVKDTRYTFTINSAGEYSTITTEEWSGSAWENTERYIDITWKDFKNSQPSGYTYQFYDVGSWVDDSKDIITYNSYGGSVDITQVKSGNNWENDERYSEMYDLHSNYLGYSDESWDGSNWFATDEEKYIFTYNGNDDVTRVIYQAWDDQIESLVNNLRWDFDSFSYFDFAGVTAPGLSSVVSFYPNPAQHELHIGLNQTDVSIEYVRVFNVIGEMVYEKSVKDTFTSVVTVPVNQLTSGTYILQCAGKDKILLAEKFVKE